MDPITCVHQQPVVTDRLLVSDSLPGRCNTIVNHLTLRVTPCALLPVSLMPRKTKISFSLSVFSFVFPFIPPHIDEDKSGWFKVAAREETNLVADNAAIKLSSALLPQFCFGQRGHSLSCFKAIAAFQFPLYYFSSRCRYTHNLPCVIYWERASKLHWNIYKVRSKWQEKVSALYIL